MPFIYLDRLYRYLKPNEGKLYAGVCAALLVFSFAASNLLEKADFDPQYFSMSKDALVKYAMKLSQPGASENFEYEVMPAQSLFAVPERETNTAAFKDSDIVYIRCLSKNSAREYFTFIKYDNGKAVAFNSNFYGLQFEYHNKGNF